MRMCVDFSAPQASSSVAATETPLDTVPDPPVKLTPSPAVPLTCQTGVDGAGECNIETKHSLLRSVMGVFLSELRAHLIIIISADMQQSDIHCSGHKEEAMASYSQGAESF